MNSYKIRVRMEVEYDIKAESTDEAYTISQNLELPSGYVENTWDTQSIKENWKEVSIPL